MRTFTNLDAAWLASLSTDLTSVLQANHEAPLINLMDEKVAFRLLAIAENLQGMDEKLGSAYGQGFTEGKLSHLARSNIVKTTRPISPNLAEAMEAFKGEVTKLPPETKVAHKDELTVDDLEIE